MYSAKYWRKAAQMRGRALAWRMERHRGTKWTALSTGGKLRRCVVEHWPGGWRDTEALNSQRQVLAGARPQECQMTCTVQWAKGIWKVFTILTKEAGREVPQREEEGCNLTPSI